jgi:serine/threonine protein kinase
MQPVVIGGTRVTPTNEIGVGGEAVVFDWNGQALKIYKDEKHPDFTGDPHAQKAARERIELHQKKLPAFPKGLPAEVIQPIELARDPKTSRVVGYTMQFLKGAEVLRRMSERSYRSQGIPDDLVVALFRNLHAAVSAVHSKGVIIGDFNDLNVLTRGELPSLIDADSFQYAGNGQTFWCGTFTARFADPLRCATTGTTLLLDKPHNEMSDWYAYAVMLMQSLLFIDPYGGVYKPKNAADRIPHGQRPLKRITVWHPEVQYPKPALPLGVLPDELLHYFHETFEKDRRDVFPLGLLDRLRWTECAGCGAHHARAVCPVCAAPGAVREVTTVRGTVTATRVFKTDGRILYATHQGGKLRWLYHTSQGFHREDGTRVLAGAPQPGMRFRIQGSKTLIGSGNSLVTLENTLVAGKSYTDTYGNLPVFDANQDTTCWIQNGQLMRTVPPPLEKQPIANVLQDHTLFWVGPEFGFGFYRAGGRTTGFVFNARVGGINDNVKIPAIKGQLVDSTCVFSRKSGWFFTSESENGRIVNRCHVINIDGARIASAEAEEGDGSWLGTVRGKCPLGNMLLAATDDGLVRVEIQGDQLVMTRDFPDTEPWVTAGSHIFPSDEGVYVVSGREIHLLKIK